MRMPLSVEGKIVRKFKRLIISHLALAALQHSYPRFPGRCRICRAPVAYRNYFQERVWCPRAEYRHLQLNYCNSMFCFSAATAVISHLLDASPWRWGSTGIPQNSRRSEKSGLKCWTLLVCVHRLWRCRCCEPSASVGPEEKIKGVLGRRAEADFKFLTPVKSQREHGRCKEKLSASTVERADLSDFTESQHGLGWKGP